LSFGQPRVELALDLLELHGAHEEHAQAEDDVDHRDDVDRTGFSLRVSAACHGRPPRPLRERYFLSAAGFAAATSTL
jgi:hypothetical protein